MCGSCARHVRVVCGSNARVSSAVRYTSIQNNTGQYNAVEWSTTQNNTIQYRTAQVAGSCQWSLVNEILQISRRPSAVCAAPLAQTCSAQLLCATIAQPRAACAAQIAQTCSAQAGRTHRADQLRLPQFGSRRPLWRRSKTLEWGPWSTLQI